MNRHMSFGPSCMVSVWVSNGFLRGLKPLLWVPLETLSHLPIRWTLREWNVRWHFL